MNDNLHFLFMLFSKGPRDVNGVRVAPQQKGDRKVLLSAEHLVSCLV